MVDQPQQTTRGRSDVWIITVLLVVVLVLVGWFIFGRTDRGGDGPDVNIEINAPSTTR